MTTQFSRPSANILLEAAQLQERKGADYNGATTSVQQADYYPRGVWSILDIVHAKYLRMVSVLENMEQGGKANFESVEDSAIDLINYASFLAAYMRGDVPGQKPGNDIFNRPVTNTTDSSLVPAKFQEYVNTFTITVNSEPNFNAGYSVFNQSSETLKPYYIFETPVNKGAL